MVDLELVLAVDVSNSVDHVEASWQREGYADALGDPAVLAAIASGPNARIAVTYVEWAGQGYQRKIIDWMIIANKGDAALFSHRLRSSGRSSGRSSAPYTSISAAIDFARREFIGNRFSGQRRVIDISGDGPNSAGRDVRDARDDAVREGITINGMPILSFRANPLGGTPATGLDLYFARNVIGGDGAFVIEANMLEKFSVALVKKLVREINPPDRVKLAFRAASQPLKTAERHRLAKHP